MTWLYLAITAQLLFAIVFAVDAFLVKTDIRNPWVFGFFIGVVSGFAALLLFVFPSVPSAGNLLLNLVAGVFVIASLVSFFALLFKYETTRVVPIIGAFVAIWSLIFDVFFLNQTFETFQYFAIAFLVLGGFLLAYEFKNQKFSWTQAQPQPNQFQ